MHWLWLFHGRRGPYPGAVLGSAGAAECGVWNTPEFFKTATPVRVQACLAAGRRPEGTEQGRLDAPAYRGRGHQNPGRDYHPARRWGRPEGTEQGRLDAPAYRGSVHQNPGRDYHPARRRGRPEGTYQGRLDALALGGSDDRPAGRNYRVARRRGRPQGNGQERAAPLGSRARQRGPQGHRRVVAAERRALLSPRRKTGRVRRACLVSKSAAAV